MRRNHNLLTVILALAAVVSLAFGFAPAAWASDGASDAVTEIDFEDDTITGDLQRPDGELVEARRRVNHTNLIRTRDTFREQVLESVGDL